MTVTEMDIHEIQAKIQPLLGKKAWGVSIGVGSFLTLDFGAKLIDKKVPERPYGEWHLWITHCAWRLEKGTEVIVASEDPRSELKKKVLSLENLALQSVKLTAPALETTFFFEGETILRLFPIYTQEYDHWKLYTPDENVLVIGPGTQWLYHSADEPRAT